MATNFSPCKGSYVLNQFPSNVMFAMNGFTYQPVERYRAIMALLFTGLMPMGINVLGSNLSVFSSPEHGVLIT